MSETLNLTEFLLARIVEDEATARDADLLSPWMLGPGPGVRTTDGDPILSIGLQTVPRSRTFLAAHIARYDPARVLDECDAKRRIVDYCDPEWGPVLRFLALPYADHPDYSEEWRP